MTLCVDLEKEPYGFVQVQGRAELSDDPGELLRTATAIAARYVGPDRAEESGSVTEGPVSWWSGYARPRCWPTSPSRADPEEM